MSSSKRMSSILMTSVILGGGVLGGKRPKCPEGYSDEATQTNTFGKQFKSMKARDVTTEIQEIDSVDDCAELCSEDAEIPKWVRIQKLRWPGESLRKCESFQYHKKSKICKLSHLRFPGSQEELHDKATFCSKIERKGCYPTSDRSRKTTDKQRALRVEKEGVFKKKQAWRHPAICSKLCEGYTFFGLKKRGNQTHCFCDNEIRPVLDTTTSKPIKRKADALEECATLSETHMDIYRTLSDGLEGCYRSDDGLDRFQAKWDVYLSDDDLDEYDYDKSYPTLTTEKTLAPSDLYSATDPDLISTPEYDRQWVRISERYAHETSTGNIVGKSDWPGDDAVAKNFQQIRQECSRLCQSYTYYGLKKLPQSENGFSLVREPGLHGDFATYYPTYNPSDSDTVSVSESLHCFCGNELETRYKLGPTYCSAARTGTPLLMRIYSGTSARGINTKTRNLDQSSKEVDVQEMNEEEEAGAASVEEQDFAAINSNTLLNKGLRGSK